MRVRACVWQHVIYHPRVRRQLKEGWQGCWLTCSKLLEGEQVAVDAFAWQGQAA